MSILTSNYCYWSQYLDCLLIGYLYSPQGLGGGHLRGLGGKGRLRGLGVHGSGKGGEHIMIFIYNAIYIYIYISADPLGSTGV